MTRTQCKIGIVGARGYTAKELIRLIAAHPACILAFVCSRQLQGQKVAMHCASLQGDLCFSNLSPEQVAQQDVDVVVLGLPNGMSAPYVEAMDRAKSPYVLMDLSADHRFDPQWYYGLPELTRATYAGQRRISNPGCYATAMQLGIAPLAHLLAAPPQCFGISGYSGSGTTPSPRNDLNLLHDNIMPYTLTDHLHEREVREQLGVAVEFMPHVAPFFRGLTVTINIHLQQATTTEEVHAVFKAYYAKEPLVMVVPTVPWVRHIVDYPHAQIGGFRLAPDRHRVVVVVTLDNLLKGAASQLMQNLNIACRYPEMTGILPETEIDVYPPTPQ